MADANWNPPPEGLPREIIEVQPVDAPRRTRGKCRCHAELLTVEPVLFLFTFALAMQMPAFSAIVYRKSCLEKFNQVVCDNLGNKSNHEAEDIVQTDSSFWFIYFSLCFEIPAIFVSFFYGVVSDVVNRRLSLALPCIGQALSIVVFILTSMSMKSSIIYLVLGQILSGLFGGWITISLASFSYLSEISTAKFRTTRTAIGEAVITLTIAFSYFIGGIILDNTSYAFVFALSGGLYLSALVYICVWLKDPPKDDDPYGKDMTTLAALKRLCNLRELKVAYYCLVRPRPDNNRKKLWMLLLTVFTSMLSFSAMFTLGYLYVKRRPFNWDQTTYGIFVGYAKLLSGCFLVISVPILKQRFEICDSVLILAAIVSTAASELFLSASQYTWMVFLVPVFGMMSDVKMTGMRSMLSSLVEPHELGRMFAAVGALQSLSGIIGSSFYNGIYPHTLSFWPGFCFLLGVIMCFIPLGMVAWIYVDDKKKGIYRNVTIGSTQEINLSTEMNGIESNGLAHPANGKVSHPPTIAFRTVY